MSPSAVTLAPESIAALAAAIVEAERAKPPVKRKTYSVEEACKALGVSRTFFDERIRRELRVIRRGKLWLIPCEELDRWVAESAERVFEAA